MNDEKIPKHFLMDRNKKVIRYIPEKDVKVLKYDKKQWEYLFPNPPAFLKRDINYRNLQLTNIASYSMAKPFIAKGLEIFINRIFKEYNMGDNHQNWTVTETNGGIGGLSIKLAEIFNKLNIVEINPVHVDMIKSNLTEYGYGAKSKKKIMIYNEDYLDVLYDIKQDLIISDPPWGGLSYSKQKYMKLGLNNINIVYVINQLLKKKKFKIFILLAMKNFDFPNFLNNLKCDNVIIHNMGKHYFIAIVR